MSETKPTTEVKTVQVDELDDLLAQPGASSVMTPNEGADDDKKPSFFGKNNVDLSFIDEEEPTDEPTDELNDDEPDDESDDKSKKIEAAKDVVEEIIDELDDTDDDEDDEPKPNKQGRNKLDKEGMSQLVNSLIKDGVILPFDDDKPMEEYTMDDYKELIQMNFQNKEEEIKQNTPKEFFEALPPELQYAAKYVMDGGTDMQGLFRTLATSQEVKQLSVDTEDGQESIIRNFLRSTNFGTDDEIEEQIDSWKDLDKLEDKAKQFKPKLDKMQEQVVQRQLAEQEERKRQREEASKQYADSIYNVLEKGQLNELKLNNKVQNMLYSGLIQPNYQSISGQPTNMFGHLIEKYQFVEPNHELIAEALWLLADPEGYRGEIKKGASNAAAEEAARKLKLEQANKSGGGSSDEPDDNKNRKPSGLKRPQKGFFKR